jgi:shikimate kinase
MARSIILIGFMGAGKSSVGRALERMTLLPRFDTDEMIAADFGKPIARIFAEDGEEAFRNAETEMLLRLRSETAAIIVTGGGIVLRSENLGLLKELGFVVHLDADAETLFARAMHRSSRPLLQTENPRVTAEVLLQKREPHYRTVADFSLGTDALDQDEVAQRILEQIPW